MKFKDPSIETLRGIAIILVVAGYIIQDDLNHTVPTLLTTWLEWLYLFLKPIRLPLFTVISGYLYAASPATRESFQKLINGKARRLLIPFFAVSTLQYILFSIIHPAGPHHLQGIFKIYLWPFEQFWFLWAIFWIFIAVGLLDRAQALDHYRKWLGWLGLAVLLYIMLSLPRFWAVRGIVYLMPCFLLGYGLQRFSRELLTRKMIGMYVVSGLLAYTAYLQLDPGISFESRSYKILSAWVSLSVLPLIFRVRPHVPALAWIGYYSFGIFLFNKIAGSLTVIALNSFSIHNEIVILVSTLGASIFFSIALNVLLEKFDATRVFILGEKPQESHAPILPPSNAALQK